MICVHCESETAAEPCEHCGEDPLIAGKYRIEEVLGRGANGTTYRAVDRKDGAVVALKELLIRHADSLKVLEMFEREARVLEQLDHPNIPHYLGEFTVDLGPNIGMYIAQEFVEGTSLDDELAEGPLDPPSVFAIVRHAARVLDYLAKRSPPVAHRDIKPANLIRRHNGEIALIDFGAVADVLGDSGGGAPTMAGTLGFMAPEQLMGQTSRTTDVYGLAATAITLLTGAPPAADERWATDLPRSLAMLLRRMLAQNPENRPRPREIVEALASVKAELEAEQTAMVQRQQTLAALTGTPRRIPQNYDHQALESHGAPLGVLFLGGMIGLAFSLLAGPASMLFPLGASGVAAAALWRQGTNARRRLRLFRFGKATMGRLDGVQAAQTTDSGDAQTVWYTFHVDGQRIRGKSTLNVKMVRADDGDDVLVLYDPDDLDHHLTYAECIFGKETLT